MFRPNYLDLFVGYSDQLETWPAAAEAATFLHFNNSCSTYVQAVPAFSSYNFKGVHDQTIPAENWFGVGVVIPHDPDYRDAYALSFSGVGLTSAKGVICVPFIGASGTTTTGEKPLLVRNMLPSGLLEDYGTSFKGCGSFNFRPDSLITNQQLVFCVGFLNTSKTAITLNDYRMTLNVSHFSVPDTGLRICQ